MKYILISLAYFAFLFVIKILIPMMRFQDKYMMAINLYKMSQEIVQTAAQYGEHVSVEEAELFYKRYHVICHGMIEVYSELEKKCDEAIESYNKLGEFITSKNVYLQQRYKLSALKQTILKEKKAYSEA